MSNTTIDVRTQKDIQKSAVSRDKFPVDFGRAWKWIGYSRKDIAKDALLRQFADSVDFKSFPVETGNRGRRREQFAKKAGFHCVIGALPFGQFHPPRKEFPPYRLCV